MDQDRNIDRKQPSPSGEWRKDPLDAGLRITSFELNNAFSGAPDGRPLASCWRAARVGMALSPAAVLVLFLAAVAIALSFPPLTGRVVDQAGIMTAQSRSDLEGKLKTLEDKSGIQLVVATVGSLEGNDIETYANQLFRNWRLGEAKKNNGVLLLVAPNEHKVRIEVGYGLEGTLTDALSSVIISSAIVPRFKASDFSGGANSRTMSAVLVRNLSVPISA